MDELDPRDEGTDAYCQKQPRSACPYPPFTKKRHSWLAGWDAAKAIDEEDKEAAAEIVDQGHRA